MIITRTRKIFEGKVVRLVIREVRLPNGNLALREVVEHAEAVAIVALDDAQQVILVRQYRIGADQELYEIPAGLVKQAKRPKKMRCANCARRSATNPATSIVRSLLHRARVYYRVHPRVSGARSQRGPAGTGRRRVYRDAAAALCRCAAHDRRPSRSWMASRSSACCGPRACWIAWPEGCRSNGSWHISEGESTSTLRLLRYSIFFRALKRYTGLLFIRAQGKTGCRRPVCSFCPERWSICFCLDRRVMPLICCPSYRNAAAAYLDNTVDERS